jgi:hypothetical protein
MPTETINDILKRALGQASFDKFGSLFTSDANQISQFFGFSPSQSEEFGRYFTPFDTEAIKKASQNISDNMKFRTDQLQNRFDTGFQNIGRQLTQSTRQLAGAAGQAGFSGFGALQRGAESFRDRAGDTLSGLMDTLDRGQFNIEQQRGTEQASLNSLINQFLSGLFSQAQNIRRFNPSGATMFDPNAMVQSGFGVGTGAGGGGGSDPLARLEEDNSLNTPSSYS